MKYVGLNNECLYTVIFNEHDFQLTLLWIKSKVVGVNNKTQRGYTKIFLAMHFCLLLGRQRAYKHKGISMCERSYFQTIVRCMNRYHTLALVARVFLLARNAAGIMSGVGIYATIQLSENHMKITTDHFKYNVLYICRQYFYYISISSTAVIVCTKFTINNIH